ncbi:hypothetical protein VTO73DRAFT_2821 [Trametes versicolor]
MWRPCGLRRIVPRLVRLAHTLPQLLPRRLATLSASPDSCSLALIDSSGTHRPWTPVDRRLPPRARALSPVRAPRHTRPPHGSCAHLIALRNVRRALCRRLVVPRRSARGSRVASRRADDPASTHDTGLRFHDPPDRFNNATKQAPCGHFVESGQLDIAVPPRPHIAPHPSLARRLSWAPSIASDRPQVPKRGFTPPSHDFHRRPAQNIESRSDAALGCSVTSTAGSMHQNKPTRQVAARSGANIFGTFRRISWASQGQRQQLPHRATPSRPTDAPSREGSRVHTPCLAAKARRRARARPDGTERANLAEKTDMSPSPRANATDGVLQIAAERFHGLSHLGKTAEPLCPRVNGLIPRRVRNWIGNEEHGGTEQPALRLRDGRGSLGAVQIRRPRANIGVGEVAVQNNSASFSDESVLCLAYRK